MLFQATPPPGPQVGPGFARRATARDDVRTLLHRATFGFTSDEYERANAMGYGAWLDEQLDPASIDDGDLDARLAGFPTLTMSAAQLFSAYPISSNGDVFVAQQLVSARILRAVESRRQLLERIVEFWTDHFNIDGTDGFLRYFKTVDDRETVREHALGNFRDLLGASARSGAMLLYLDNYVNSAGAPNENYARELMELHTIGPDAFTQQDVEEVARCFTGWSISGRRPSEPFGLFSFRAATHDGGPRTVLGAPIPSGGMEQGEAVLDRLFDHPGTAQLVCRKLVQRFVSDRPPQALVDRAAEAFRSTEGDIPAVLRTILLSAEFEASDGGKLKRPFEFVVSVARGFDLPPDTQLLSGLAQVIAQMGQRPFGWPAPNGYPDSGAAWANTAGMLRRWNFGLAFEDAGRFQGIDLAAEISAVSPTASAIVDHFVERLLHRSVSTLDRETMIAFVRDTVGDGPLSSSESLEAARRALVLVLDSPYFHSR